ncbi:MAG: dihydrolipoamide dehydrogenase [Flammeovirgaceae bacterium]|nr:dihydrolipoamide dehydrogenase [Flammeovirgaceae bacterium]
MRIIYIMFLLFVSFYGFSQLKTPSASTSSEIEQVVGLTEIEVDYNRPSKRGRVIFGNLVPFGKIWRTGANSGTEISFSTDVSINGENINEGTYSIFSIPNEESWQIIFYSDTDLWSVPRNWEESKIIFQSNFKSNTNNKVVETFSISFEDITNNNVNLVFSWDDTNVIVPIDVPTKSLVEDQIKSIMGDDPKSSDYYSAAVYYLQENINLDIALKWMNKAIEMIENPRFFQLRQQSLILAANGQYKNAIKVAEKSLELSIQANNGDYVKMNNDSIEEWSNM